MIILTNDLMRKIYPRGNARIMAAIVERQSVMADILATIDRTAVCFANGSAETSGLSLAGLVENINYTQKRMADVWRNRFKGDASAVAARYGSGPDWRQRAFDEIYGFDSEGRPRMGNRPGTHDGSTYIGRGWPQVTGRDGYAAVGQRCGVDLLNNPARASEPENQAAIMAAFWKWKNMNRYADLGAGGIEAGRKVWNGGTNALGVVETEYARIRKILIAWQPTSAAPNVQVPMSNVDETLRDYQRALIDFGYFEVGEADGRIGGKTLGAIKAFFTDRGVTAKSEYPSVALDNAITAALRDTSIDKDGNTIAWKRPVAPKRAFATVSEVADKVASVAPVSQIGFVAKIGAWVSGIFTVGAGTVKGTVEALPDANDQVSPYISVVQQYIPSVSTLAVFAVVLAVAIYIARKSGQANASTQADYQTGKIN